ncbi:HET-domain-containing protein [Rostrohypoxylon terebratum]|nr:HET-domain-containing protein [Rostrohypoxylon terebratum]
MNEINMALCSLCRAIPFNQLPEPHSLDDGWCRVFDESELPLMMCRGHEHGPENPIGYSWHLGLGALAASADTCTLCSIIHQGVQRWLSHFEQGRQTQFYEEFQDTYSYSVPTEERLWLTKRFGGGPGFVVLARESRGGEIHLLTGVAFSVDASNPAAQTIQLRPSDLDSGSVYSLDIAASFLRKCHDQHEGCSTSESLLPSRIIDTGSPDGLIRLIEPQGQSGSYACLSYCWGEIVNFTTTHTTIESRRQGFEASELPKTMSDAVRLVRHLGIRYLWIDSLCICQDDREDWARESSRMAGIYAGADLVIAVNRGSDSSAGCFHIRPARPAGRADLPGYANDVHIELIYNSDELDWDHGGFESEPLSNRCWALQERVLARRILHFNSRQMYYECNSGIIGEDGSNSSRRFGMLKDLDQSVVSWEWPSADYLWYSLIGDYGARALTQPTDMLPAMSGLARLFAAKFRADYVAGIWSHSLLKGLTWQCIGSRQPVSQDQYTGPSWSWASYGGMASIGPSGKFNDVAEVLDWEVELKTQANPFGAVTSAWLHIRAPIVSLIHVPAEGDEAVHATRLERAGLPPIVLVKTSYSEGLEEDIRISFDNDEIPRTGAWKDMEMKLMILVARDPCFDEDDDGTHGVVFSLVVTNAGDPSSNRMKRIGWMFISDTEVERILEDDTNRRTVYLV